MSQIKSTRTALEASTSTNRSGVALKSLSCVLFGLILPLSAMGVDWEFKPRVSLQAIYTDNYLLSADDEESETVYILTPGVSLRGKSDRLKLDFDYQLEGVKGKDNDEVYHQLSTRGTAELAEDLFFLDADARYFQSLINSNGRITVDNVNPTVNRTDVFSANISPYLRTRLAGDLDFLLKYRYGVVQYGDEEDAPVDSEIQEAAARLGNLDAAARKWSWQVAAHSTQTDTDNVDAVEFRTASASLGYRFTSRLQLVLDGGVDDNDFPGEELTDTSNEFWNLSLRLGLGERDRLEAGFGNRYNDQVYRFLWAHSGRRVSLGLTYDHTLETTANALAVQDALADSSTPDLFSTQPDVFTRKTLSFNTGIKLSRNNLGVTARYERRESLIVTGDEQKVTTLNAFWNWHLGSRTDFNLSYLTGRQNNADQEDSEITGYTVSFSRSFGPKWQGNLSYSNNQQKSDGDSQNEYQENRFQVGVRGEF